MHRRARLRLLALLRRGGAGALDDGAERGVADRALEDAHARGAHYVGPAGGGGPEEVVRRVVGVRGGGRPGRVAVQVAAREPLVAVPGLQGRGVVLVLVVVVVVLCVHRRLP